MEVLKRLDDNNLKRLHQFLLSPYFNDTRHASDLCRLYERIVQFDAEIDSPELDKKVVSELIYPEWSFEEKVKGPLDALASNLFQLVRRYLAQQDWERENPDFHNQLALIRFYRKNDMEDRYWKALEALRADHRRLPLRDAQYYHQRFKIEEEETIFRGSHNAHKDDINLHAAHQNLDIYYSIVKLEMSCFLENQKQTTQLESPIDTRLQECVLELVREGSYLNIPLNQIYQTVLDVIRHPQDEQLIAQLEQLLRQHEAQIPFEKMKDLMAYCRNFWVNRYYRSGDQHSRERVFQLYRDHLKQGLFYQDGMIPFSTARNIVVFGLKLGEYAWLREFLDSHPPERICGTRYPAEVHSLNTADYYFALKEYEKAQEAIVYRNFENARLGFLADILLIKIYFETENELLAFRMKALDQKIRRTKLSSAIKERHLNFLRKLDKIIKYGWQKSHAKNQRLIEEIRETSNIVSREWLLEKLSPPA
ncbi:MAG: hypothetical protein JNK89_09205 [Saprospiraceae bacterium]|nr:hypothetical protein [Saprospiraceae bacterium]